MTSSQSNGTIYLTPLSFTIINHNIFTNVSEDITGLVSDY